MKLSKITLVAAAFAALASAVVFCKKEKPTAGHGLLLEADGKKYVLPRPSHLFTALNSHGVKWEMQADPVTKRDYTSEEKLALNFGMRAAEGLVLIYSGRADAAKVNVAGMRDLAKQLGVEDALSAGVQDVGTAFDKKDDAMIRSALDKMSARIESELLKRGDDRLAVLVSLGGWVEGLHVTTAALSKHYDPAAAELLRQSQVVKIYREALSGSGNVKVSGHDKVIKDIQGFLPDVETLTNVGPGQPVSADNVKKLYDIAEKMKKAVQE